jgi:type I restriction enzyme S subunit
MDKRKEDKLPASWVKTTVGEICSKIVDGSHNPPAKRNDGIPMLSARNIENGRIEFDNFRYISLRDYEIENARTQISFNDVLLTIVGSIGRTSVVPENARPFALQRSVAVLKPIEVLPKFCMYQFQSHVFQSNLMSAAQGTAQKGIYLKRLANLPFIIAPLAEQQRIVEEIEMQFSRLDEAVKSIKRIQKNLQRLRRTILQWACEGKLVATEAELARLENRIFEPAAELLKHSLGERYTDWEAKQISKTDESGKSPKGSNWKTKYCDSVVPNTKDLPEISEGWVWNNLLHLNQTPLPTDRLAQI